MIYKSLLHCINKSIIVVQGMIGGEALEGISTQINHPLVKTWAQAYLSEYRKAMAQRGDGSKHWATHLPTQ